MLDKVSRILLVEDNKADVYLFRKALEAADLQCRANCDTRWCRSFGFRPT